VAKIQLILVDDWELRGDGSGDMRTIQFATLRRLLEIYERHGLRASINAEVMQQLNHLAFGAQCPSLAALASEWEEIVQSIVARGHDVQLHLHTQWWNARFADGRWVLPSNWSIAKHTRADVREMIQRGKAYLEQLVRKVRPDYRCVSFRAGSWSIAPSDHALSVLAEEGIVLDVSMVNGIAYANEKVELDYRGCEEPFLPYYPDMRDARKLSNSKTPIVCFPTFSFITPLAYRLRRDLFTVTNLVRRGVGLRPTRWPKAGNETAPAGQTEWEREYAIWKPTLEDPCESAPRRLTKRIQYRIRGERRIADLSTQDTVLMDCMLGEIRRRARQSGWPVVPVVLENHTKDVGDFGAIEHLSRRISADPDIDVITLSDACANLAAGVYRPVLKAAA
jgi:hypothetical protein